MTNLVQVINTTVTTTSLQVAEYFKKDHKNILRDIYKILKTNESLLLNFEPSNYIAENGKEYTNYRIDKKGFTLLAMGFTGVKALQFKINYIDAFEKMEAELKKPQALPDYPTALRQLATQYEVNQILEKQLKEAEDERLTLLDRNINVEKVKDLKGTIRAFKDDEGRSINSYVIKHFLDGKDVNYNQAHTNAKEAYYKATGEKLPHYAVNMSLEQKKSYRRFLSSL